MNDKTKIKNQAAKLKQAGELLQHLSSMVVTATQALRYIAAPVKDESKIILLKSVGLPEPDIKKQPAEEVAIECLQVLYDLQQDYNNASTGPNSPPVERSSPEEVRLKDGQEIVFSTDFDILYHQCCRCGLLHEVELEWEDLADGRGGLSPLCNPILTTKWTQIDSLPSEASVTEAGHAVIRKRDLQ